MYSFEHKEQKLDDSHITKLYYGFNRVYFKQCKGKTFTFDEKLHSFKSLSDAKSLSIVKQRRLPQTNLGSEYSHLLLPSMPCNDIKILNFENQSSKAKANGLISLSPLIKTKQTDYAINKNIIGYKSGIRSALICINDDENKDNNNNNNNGWYRFKGCGNNEMGYFPFQCIEDGQNPLIEIRGCCFEHTAFRELKMTNNIELILNEYNICSANQSYGWYEYNIDKYCPKIKRLCAIFKTIGNKRLGDHVLFGLLKILPLIIDIKNVSIENIYNQFPNSRQQNDETYKVMETYWAVLSEIEIINLCNNNINIPLKCIDTKMDDDFQWLFVENNNIKYKQSLWKYEMDCYNELLNEFKQNNQNQNQNIINELIIDIYYRLGFETGFIQKLLHINNISWGTYNDSLGTHCNAHCNNYVILPYNQSIQYDFCLAPLDFDMAFHENEYIKNMNENKNIKQYTFKELIKMEFNGNKGSLSGDPDISTGVHWNINDIINKYKWKNNQEKNKFDLINWSLTDTLINSFHNAYYNQKKETFKWNQKKQKLMYSIFNLALIATIDVVA